jgi:hypothetical protein
VLAPRIAGWTCSSPASYQTLYPKSAERAIPLSVTFIREAARPLAWDPEIGSGIHAVEVYPAATLATYKVPTTGYKKRKDNLPARRKLIAFLGKHLRLPEDTSTMKDNADTLDAGLCVLAAVDFLRGNVIEPEGHMPKARKEGWIWVRGRGHPADSTPRDSAACPSRQSAIVQQ